MTVDEFLDLPDDGIRRELIRGIVKTYPSDADDPGPSWRERPMTIRSRAHCRLLITLACEAENWLRTRPKPRGEFVGGECGFRLGGPDDNAVGIDLAYASAEQVAAMDPDTRVFVGPPVLAIEILSPSDTQRDVVDMLRLYQEFGVIVWIGNPELRTVSVHQPGMPPETFNERQELVGDPYLPGFRVPVSRLFD
jgi:Uma2 family endonuclease